MRISPSKSRPKRRRRGSTQCERIAFSRQSASPSLGVWLIRCERQYIRGAIFATVGAVPLRDFRIGDQADRKCVGGNAQQPPQLSGKFLQLANGNFHLTLLVENHVTGLGAMILAGRMG